MSDERLRRLERAVASDQFDEEAIAVFGRELCRHGRHDWTPWLDCAESPKHVRICRRKGCAAAEAKPDLCREVGYLQLWEMTTLRAITD